MIFLCGAFKADILSRLLEKNLTVELSMTLNGLGVCPIGRKHPERPLEALRAFLGNLSSVTSVYARFIGGAQV